MTEVSHRLNYSPVVGSINADAKTRCWIQRFPGAYLYIVATQPRSCAGALTQTLFPWFRCRLDCPSVQLEARKCSALFLPGNDWQAKA